MEQTTQFCLDVELVGLVLNPSTSFVPALGEQYTITVSQDFLQFTSELMLLHETWGTPPQTTFFVQNALKPLVGLCHSYPKGKKGKKKFMGSFGAILSPLLNEYSQTLTFEVGPLILTIRAQLALLANAGFLRELGTPTISIPSRLRTGDIVLFVQSFGNSLFNKNKWDHVALALGFEGKMYLFEGINHSISLNEASKRFRTELKRGSKIGVRHLYLDRTLFCSQSIAKLNKYLGECFGKPDGSHFLASLQGHSTKTAGSTSQFLCAELVAGAFKAMGIMDDSRANSSFTPHDFSLPLPLLNGGFLSEISKFTRKSTFVSRGQFNISAPSETTESRRVLLLANLPDQGGSINHSISSSNVFDTEEVQLNDQARKVAISTFFEDESADFEPAIEDYKEDKEEEWREVEIYVDSQSETTDDSLMEGELESNRGMISPKGEYVPITPKRGRSESSKRVGRERENFLGGGREKSGSREEGVKGKLDRLKKKNKDRNSIQGRRIGNQMILVGLEPEEQGPSSHPCSPTEKQKPDPIIDMARLSGAQGFLFNKKKPIPPGPPGGSPSPLSPQSPQSPDSILSIVRSSGAQGFLSMDEYPGSPSSDCAPSPPVLQSPQSSSSSPDCIRALVKNTGAQGFLLFSSPESDVGRRDGEEADVSEYDESTDDSRKSVRFSQMSPTGVEGNPETEIEPSHRGRERSLSHSAPLGPRAVVKDLRTINSQKLLGDLKVGEDGVVHEEGGEGVGVDGGVGRGGERGRGRERGRGGGVGGGGGGDERVGRGGVGGVGGGGGGGDRPVGGVDRPVGGGGERGGGEKEENRGERSSPTRGAGPRVSPSQTRHGRDGSPNSTSPDKMSPKKHIRNSPLHKRKKREVRVPSPDLKINIMSDPNSSPPPTEDKQTITSPSEKRKRFPLKKKYSKESSNENFELSRRSSRDFCESRIDDNYDDISSPSFGRVPTKSEKKEESAVTGLQSGGANLMSLLESLFLDEEKKLFRPYIWHFLLTQYLYSDSQSLLSCLCSLVVSQENQDAFSRILKKWMSWFPEDWDESLRHNLSEYLLTCFSISPVVKSEIQTSLAEMKTEENVPCLDEEEFPEDDRWLKWDPEIVSRHLFSYHVLRIQNIPPRHFIFWVVSKDKKKDCPRLWQVIERANRITDWVMREIVIHPKCSDRVRRIEFFIDVAMECISIGDFFSAKVLDNGLHHPAISRMKKTLSYLSKKSESKLLKLRELLNTSQENGARYRTLEKKTEGENKSFIPFLGIHFKDIIYTLDGVKDFITEGIINIKKFISLAKQIQGIVSAVSLSEEEEKIYLLEREKRNDICKWCSFNVYGLLSNEELFRYSRRVDPTDSEVVIGNLIEREKELLRVIKDRDRDIERLERRMDMLERLLRKGEMDSGEGKRGEG